MGTVNIGVINPVYGDKVPSKYISEVNNLKVNPFDGRTFGSPSYATVFADPNQASYDYRLAPGSPALNAAADPGRSLHGQDLVPQYQSSWHGLPTRGHADPGEGCPGGHRGRQDRIDRGARLIAIAGRVAQKASIRSKQRTKRHKPATVAVLRRVLKRIGSIFVCEVRLDAKSMIRVFRMRCSNAETPRAR